MIYSFRQTDKILIQHVASDPPTSSSLCKLVQEFLQLQEDYLGRAAKNPPFTRRPVRLFYDMTTNGSLCHILLAMYKYR